MNLQLLTAFGAYFGILLIVGLISHRKQTTSAEFIVGNRSLNFWVTALSAHASDMSSWLFMGYPAAILLGGLVNVWLAVALIIGMFINWQFVAKKLRSETEKFKSYTLSSYFESRLQDTSGFIRLATALMTLFFLTWYLASGLIGMGLLFESVFGIDYEIGLSIALLVAVIYTLYGGFITVAWTDLFQALFLLVFIVLVPFVAYQQLPHGIDSILEVAALKGTNLELFPSGALLSTLFVMSWGLGYWGQPHILTKFMGINNVNDMGKAKWVGITWQIITLSAATCIGLIGIAFFYHQGLNNPSLIFIEMVKVLFHPFIAGFVLCAVLAATMSTMDSQILVCASVLSEDCYKRFFRPNASEKEKVRVSRAGVVLISLLALMIAFQRSNTVFEAVEYAWMGLGSSFGPLLLMCLYSKRIDRVSGIAGIAVGGLLAATWHLINPFSMVIPPMIPAFFLSLLTIYALSRTKKIS